jgi:tetratricopeptide (TPR) repeat protein
LVQTGSHCHALGGALRRAGRPEHAATLHEAASLIFGRVGNTHAEALATNSVGVALAEAGNQEAAVEHFEQARALVRALDDDEWEGKILANLSLAKQRAGQDDDAVSLLHRALEKLSPDTDAYRRVEERLKEAS